jgi:hypothetical protein
MRRTTVPCHQRDCLNLRKNSLSCAGVLLIYNTKRNLSSSEQDLEDAGSITAQWLLTPLAFALKIVRFARRLYLEGMLSVKR